MAIKAFVVLLAACLHQPNSDLIAGFTDAKLIESAAPLRIVEFTIDGDAGESLRTQLKRYAEEFGFAIRIVPVTSDNKRILIELRREEIEIVGTNHESPIDYTLAFYKSSEFVAIPESLLKSLVMGLIDSLGKVKGLVVTKH